ncbi:MAG: hypothetical protein PVF47_13425 [Anaerolineae bacterium]|jgi:hypothetical protein
MTRERKLLIALGTALIILMVAVASFSLGVYAGVNGWTAGSPAVAGPGPQPLAAQGDPIQRDPHPQLVGRVRSVSLAAGADTLTLDTPQGTRLVHLATGIEVRRVVVGSGEVPAGLDEIRPGLQLAVFGRLENADGQQQFVARRLLLLPAASPPAQP